MRVRPRIAVPFLGLPFERDSLYKKKAWRRTGKGKRLSPNLWNTVDQNEVKLKRSARTGGAAFVGESTPHRA